MHPAFALMGNADSALDLLPYPSVGIASIDREHAILAYAHARVKQLINNEPLEVTTIDLALGQLLTALLAHFEQEESEMKAAQYPYLPVHRRQHQRALEQLALFIGRWRKQRNVWALRDFIDGPFADWFIRHIEVPDKMAAAFMLQQQEHT